MTPSEELIAKSLQRIQIEVLRNGWPDFLCIKPPAYEGGKRGVFAVEVKSGTDTLSKAQRDVHHILRQAGIPTYVLRPEDAIACKSKRLPLWTHEDLRFLVAKFDRLELEVKSMQAQADNMRAMLELATVMFDESPSSTQALRSRLSPSYRHQFPVLDAADKYESGIRFETTRQADLAQAAQPSPP